VRQIFAAMMMLSVLSSLAVSSADPLPPIISMVRANNIYSSGARIEWTTNVNSDGVVEFGTTAAYGMTTAISPFIMTTHSVSVGGLAPDAPLALKVSRISGSTKFTAGGDRCSVSGAIPSLPSDFSFAGQQLTLNVGGAEVVFVLDAKGRGKSPMGTFAFKIKMKKREKGSAMNNTADIGFSAKLQKGTWAQIWGISSNATEEFAQMETSIEFGGNVYVTSTAVKMSVKGNGGQFRQ
jgi:hypothetical protein